MLDALIETISTWENYEYYVAKLRKLRPVLLERGRKAFDAQAEQFNTLIHGDMWASNIMITYSDFGKSCRHRQQQQQSQYENKQLENLALIDFQFSCWTSPAIDLHYFFNTSLSEELRLHHQEELIQYYHRKLTTILKCLNYQKHVPTLLEFQVQFLEKSIYGMYAMLLKAFPIYSVVVCVFSLVISFRVNVFVSKHDMKENNRILSFLQSKKERLSV